MKRITAFLSMTVLLGACAALQPPEQSASTYLLDARLGDAPRRPQRGLVLAIAMPRARPGFDTARMAYLRQPQVIEYFARNRWADAPARMLAPLLAQATERSGGIRAVVLAPGSAAADLRLEIELVRLLQDFTVRPSRVRFTLRAQLIDAAARRVLATREFDESEDAAAENAYGGAIAANRALERLLGQVAEFVAMHADRR